MFTKYETWHSARNTIYIVVFVYMFVYFHLIFVPKRKSKRAANVNRRIYTNKRLINFLSLFFAFFLKMWEGDSILLDTIFFHIFDVCVFVLCVSVGFESTWHTSILILSALHYTVIGRFLVSSYLTKNNRMKKIRSST